jgi:hypothetical protein
LPDLQYRFRNVEPFLSGSAEKQQKNHHANPLPATAKAPGDAVVILDGKTLDAWRNSDGGPAKWIVCDGAMEPVNGGG